MGETTSFNVKNKSFYFRKCIAFVVNLKTAKSKCDVDAHGGRRMVVVFVNYVDKTNHHPSSDMEVNRMSKEGWTDGEAHVGRWSMVGVCNEGTQTHHNPFPNMGVNAMVGETCVSRFET